MRRIPIKAMNLMYDDSNFKMYQDDHELTQTLRRLEDLREVIYDHEFYMASLDRRSSLYYMYHDICREGDRYLLRKFGLRFDVTIIPSKLLGREYVKTMGHYHPVAEEDLTYPEVYEVLEGEAHYLLQREKDQRIVEVTLVKARRGSKFIIPPNYGHVTINPSNETLVTINLVSSRFEPRYEPFRNRGGGAYFETVNKGFVKNERYRDVPPLKIMEAKEIGWLPYLRDLYTLFLKNPNVFLFLNEPKKSPVTVEEISWETDTL